MKTFISPPLFCPILYFILFIPSCLFVLLFQLPLLVSDARLWFISHSISIWDSTACKDQTSSVTMWLPLIVHSLDAFLLGHWRDALWIGTLGVFIVMGSLISWEMCKFHILSTKECEARLLIYLLVIYKRWTPDLGRKYINRVKTFLAQEFLLRNVILIHSGGKKYTLRQSISAFLKNCKNQTWAYSLALPLELRYHFDKVFLNNFVSLSTNNKSFKQRFLNREDLLRPLYIDGSI